MTIQMTFTKDARIKGNFNAHANGDSFLINKSSFGWLAFVFPAGGLGKIQIKNPEGGLVHDNRGMAEYACNLFANLKEQQV